MIKSDLFFENDEEENNNNIQTTIGLSGIVLYSTFEVYLIPLIFHINIFACEITILNGIFQNKSYWNDKRMLTKNAFIHTHTHTITMDYNAHWNDSNCDGLKNEFSKEEKLIDFWHILTKISLIMCYSVRLDKVQRERDDREERDEAMNWMARTRATNKNAIYFSQINQSIISLGSVCSHSFCSSFAQFLL